MLQAAFAKCHLDQTFAMPKGGLLRLWSDCASASMALAAFFERLAAGDFEQKQRKAVAQNNVSAIAGYANFINAHPDMPISHRQRFLKQISRCCEEALHQGR